MKKKSIFIVLLVTVFSISMLAACSSSSDEPSYSDKAFINSMAKGLEARWAIIDKNGEGHEDTVQDYKDFIQAELDQVEKYQSAAFEDTTLQEKALAYINVLKESMENVDYAFSDTDYQKWSDIYDKRTIMIKDFVDNYGLTVSSKYQDDLDGIVANGKTAGVQSDQKAALESLVAGLQFELVENDYGWKKYEAVLENTTDYDITTMSIDVSLLDKDGVILETQYTSADNVAKGQKARLEFSTEQDFDRYELVLDYFEAK